ncbi:PGS1 [[Candida] subhashii]|uniref:CDP-diacylglycerol--glycerol-3-phosphate 3-phosphatidyltransferase n=1 Tax=[Candida] subhashii TaxID=561895 RepID=A0A8J5QN10_9ASCO|nr:PGS1 [[Candida] subhashii]KAG7663323.1 PGS1 [[Candida] subhashii]
MISSIYNYLFNNNNNNQNNQHSSIRNYSTNNPTISNDLANTFHPRLKTIFEQLDSIAPRFLLKSGEIDILTEPNEFYNTLKQKISTAKNRVYLSSLYIGKSQHELIQCIDDALTTNEDLKVYILTDALRGTREAPHQPCSANLLVPLVEKFGKHRIDVRMYHTPHLSGLTKSVTPKRINEGWGLQHMKLYGFDDEIILSGANLSQDYFTDRQDRYYLFKNKSITDYYYRIHMAISSLSYQIVNTKQLKQGFRMSWPTSNKSCEPHMNRERFISDSSYLLEPILKQHSLGAFKEFSDHEDYDTIVYPVSQFTPLFPHLQDCSTEKPAILRILAYLDSPKIKWWFTAGYFNMLPEIQERLLNGKAQGSVITASPKANSFYKSPGVSYYLPEAYLLFAKRFLEKVKDLGKSSLITVYEWQNGIVNTPGGWSYHAKGLWVTVPEENEPSITVIGSSNYTKRAYSLDLESNAIIITKDANLKSKMKHEIDHLMEHASELSLKDFQPKPISIPVDSDVIVKEKVAGNQSQEGDELAPQNSSEKPPKYLIDEDRKISYGVHLAVKLLGGKL